MTKTEITSTGTVISIVLMMFAGLTALLSFSLSDPVGMILALVLLSYARIAQTWNQKK